MDIHQFFLTFTDYAIYYLLFLVVGFLIGFFWKKKIINKHKKKADKLQNKVSWLNTEVFNLNKEIAELKRKFN